jgi:asparagine synthase (glutamine-hydrolysing)
LTSLLAAKNVLNLSKTFHFLEAGFSDYDHETFVSGVNMLMPGEVKIFSINGLKELGTSSIKFIDHHPVQLSHLGYNDKVIALRETLQNVISLHTRTDVGFCATLSGGLDSTAIAGILLNQGHTNLKLYSYIPELVGISEEKWIDIASAHFDIPVIKMRYDTSDFWSEFDIFSEQIDGPYNSSSMYSQYKIYQNVKKDANTVVLDGQGGDEMFGGYIQYIYYRVYELLLSGQFSSLSKFVKGSRQTVALSFLAKNLVRLLVANKVPNVYHFLRNNQSDAIVKVDYFRTQKVQQIPSFDRDLLMEKLKVDRTTQDLPRLLRYADRNSMAWSLESRVPFASQPIQSFVQQLESSDIISDHCTTKALFRDAIEPYIPAQIFHRKDKKGFNTDDISILSSYEARDYVSSLHLSKFTFIDKQALLDSLGGKKSYRSDKLWRIFSLLKWLDKNKIDV